MKTSVSVLFFAIFMIPFCQNIQAQSNFKEGYIITLHKDTVRGLIDYRTDKMNAKQCVFKTSAENNERTYQPGEIQGYRFADEGKFYITHMVTPNQSPEKTVFLEYLLQGVKSLYYYVDEQNEKYYFIEHEGKLIKLDAPVVEKKGKDNIKYKKQVRRYIPTLKFLMNDYPSLQAKVEKTPFTHQGLIEIVKEYNDLICGGQNQCTIFETKEDKKLLNFDVTPYVGLVGYIFPSEMQKQFGNSELSYLFGVNVSVTCTRWINTINFTADLALSKQNIENTAKQYYFTSTLLTFKLGVRYTFPGKRWRPFVGIGGEMNRYTSEKIRSADYSKYENHGNMAPGGYVDAGLQYRLAKNWKRYIILRGQFETARNMPIKSNAFRAWSGSLGFAF